MRIIEITMDLKEESRKISILITNRSGSCIMDDVEGETGSLNSKTSAKAVKKRKA